MTFEYDWQYWEWFNDKTEECILDNCCKGGTPMFIEDGDILSERN